MENRQLFRALSEQMRSHFLELRTLLKDIYQHEVHIIRNQEKIMATLDEVLADVADESTRIDSLGAFIAGLKQQIVDALAGTTLPAAVQAKVDAVFAGVESNKGKIDTLKAMDANVPDAPPAPPTP